MINIASLVLGLIAWIVPVINFLRFKKNSHNNWAALTVLSISACAMSLCFQIFNIYQLVRIEDWSALMDTMGAVTFVSAVLLIVTILLNVCMLIVNRERAVK